MLQFIANGLCRGLTLALVAAGFSLIFSTTRVLHVAHGGVYVFAAYVLYTGAVLLALPVPIAAILAIIFASLLAVLLEKIVYQPLAARKASKTVVLISSLGIYIVIVNLLAMVYGAQSRVVRSGAELTFSSSGVILTQVQLLEVVVAGAVLLAYWLLLSKSRIGRTCRAVADAPELAEVMGVKTKSVRLWVFVSGSVLASIASVLMILDLGVDPFVGFHVFIFAFVACVIGGLHRLLAPILGAVTLGVLQSMVVWQSSSAWEPAVTFGVLILFLLVRPQGILGVVRRTEEL